MAELRLSEGMLEEKSEKTPNQPLNQSQLSEVANLAWNLNRHTLKRPPLRVGCKLRQRESEDVCDSNHFIAARVRTII